MEDPGKVLEAMYAKLDQFLKTETVVGTPFTVGAVTLVPIVNVAFGLGGGLGTGKEERSNSSGSGGGGGVGCRITPNAILVVKNDEVSAIPLKGRGSLDKLFEMVPEIIAKLESHKGRKGAAGEGEQEEKQEG